MDHEMRAYLEGMEARLSSRHDSTEIRLGAMETRLGAMETRLDAMETRFDAMETRFDAMETRMMTRINDNQERLLERMRGFEMVLASLVELNRSTNMMLVNLTGIVTDLVKRVTDLEKKS